jgi:hypothetical protein
VKLETALRKLEEMHGKRRALGLIAFAMFVDMYGAAAMRRKYDRMTVWRDLKALKDAGVEPATVDWGEVESSGQAEKATTARRRPAAVSSRGR